MARPKRERTSADQDVMPTPKKRSRRSNQENEEDDENVVTNTEQSIRNLFATTEINDLSISHIHADDEDDSIRAAGQVIGIELENFMCHKNLQVKFDADKYNCFYIVGANGSGKSAIFAGLNIGLGGKGRNNDRGSSLASYIKEGETSAKTRIILRNVGDNRHPDYDDKIIIERTIRHTSSTYALKSGKKDSSISHSVSTCKKDLDGLLKRFSIELENPLCWLSQDRARQFLQQMKPEKLYEIFMITSELKMAADKHVLTEENFHDLDVILEENCEKQRRKKKAFEELKAKATAAERCVELKKKISNANWLKCWVPSVQVQKEIQAIELQINQITKKKEEVDSRVKGRTKEGNQLKETVKQFNDEYAELNKQYHEARGTISSLEKKQDEINTDLISLKHSVKQKEHKIKTYTNEIVGTKKALEDIIGSSDRDVFAEKQDLKTKLTKIEQDVEADNEQKKLIMGKRDRLYVERKRKGAELSEIQYKIQQAERDIKKAERDIEETQAVAKDKMRRFGEHTSKIVDLLNKNASKFRKCPIGPIGMYVEVNDKWRDPVEYNLRNSLRTYICDNAEDRKTFEKLCNQSRIPVPQSISVVAFSNTKNNTDLYSPDRNYNTVCRMVKIENPTVFNFLVDKNSMEQTLLIETDEEARDLMQNSPPQHVRITVTMKCSDVHPKGPNKPYRFYAGQSYRSSLLGQQESGIDFFVDRIRKIKLEIASYVEEEKVSLAENERFSSTFAEISKDVQSIDKRIHDNEQVVQKMKAEISELDKVVTREALINNSKKIIEDVTAQKQIVEDELEKVFENQRKCQEKQDGIKFKMDEAMAHVAAIKGRVASKETDYKKHRAELEQFDTRTDEIRFEALKHQKRLDKANVIKYELDKKEKQVNAMLETNLPKFLKPDNVTNPPEFNMIPLDDKLQTLLEKSAIELRKVEKLCGSESVTKQDLLDAQRALDDASKEVKKIVSSSTKAKNAFQKRKDLYEKIMNDLPRRLKDKFCEYMLLRNYSGDLKVDSVNKRIDITVETHRDAHKNPLGDGDDDNDVASTQTRRVTEGSKKKKVVQDLKGLSGGERSYTTACFVMALWTCVDSPFRCLDEFDVFMDMQNRRIIMELLTELARKNRHIQFFFFTPQSISELKCEDVEVFQLFKKAN